MTLCESVGLCVAGKRSFDGCGFRSGCPVVSAHGCDTVNHAAITHARRHLHGRCTHTHTHICSPRHSCAKKQTVCMCTLLLCCFFFQKKKKRFNLLFYLKEDCLSHDCLARFRELYFPSATSCKVHSNYDCTFGNDYSYHMMGSAASA